jgi:hypothetical protein
LGESNIPENIPDLIGRRNVRFDSNGVCGAETRYHPFLEINGGSRKPSPQPVVYSRLGIDDIRIGKKPFSNLSFLMGFDNATISRRSTYMA